MSKATRKHISPGVLVTALGVVAALALMAAVVWLPGAAQAQSGPQNPFVPADPTGVMATEDSATQITVSWMAGSGGSAVTGYEVERKVGSGSYVGVDPAHSGTMTNYVDTNVESGMTYMYRVRANGSGAQNSAWAESDAVTVMAPMPPPTIDPTPASVADGSPCDKYDTKATADMAAMAATDCVSSSSTSASATVELKLVIESLDPPGDVAAGEDDLLAVGGSIVLYLEDDFAEPDEISASDVYFVSNPVREVTGNGGRVYATVDPVISNSDYFTADKDDIAIQIFVPDMCRNATTDCEGDNGLMAGDTISVVVTKGAGLKNASEEGTHSTGFAVLASDHTGSVPGMGDFTVSNTVGTVAKIGLSDVDNSRGYELTVTGSGFNNGTTAGAYVLHIAGTDPDNAHRNAYLWNALDCAEMVAAVGDDRAANMSNPYCAMYAGLGDAEKAVVGALDFSSGAAEAALCSAIIRSGTKAGGALVGSDDKVAATFEVTVPTFGPGQTNHICMVDGEGRTSKTDVEDFNLEPSIAVVPSTASTGDTVNVFAQDFQNVGQSFSLLKIGGQTMAPNGMDLNSFITDRESISISGTRLDHLGGPRRLRGHAARRRHVG